MLSNSPTTLVHTNIFFLSAPLFSSYIQWGTLQGACSNMKVRTTFSKFLHHCTILLSLLPLYEVHQPLPITVGVARSLAGYKPQDHPSKFICSPLKTYQVCKFLARHKPNNYLTSQVKLMLTQNSSGLQVSLFLCVFWWQHPNV